MRKEFLKKLTGGGGKPSSTIFLTSLAILFGCIAEAGAIGSLKLEEFPYPESSVAATQQGRRTVRGTIIDELGEPIMGATIKVLGTTNGTASDMDGNFMIDNVDDGATLEISYIGYISQTIKVSGNAPINIQLMEDSQELGEVVVVGYGTQKKEHVAGAISTLKGEEIASAAAFDVTNAISGRLTGTFVNQSSGEPGKDEASILIRGRATLGSKTGGNLNPLVVIDGIPDRSLYELDPNDIENISVLKDASAAIYGSRAANGVILITTKRGASSGGKKSTVNYQYNIGFNKPTILPKTADAVQYAQYISDYQDYQGLTRLYSNRDIELFKSGIDPWEHPNTNWMDELVRDWTTEQRHNVSLSGGNDKMRYYASFGYKDNTAIYKSASTKYKQYNYRLKLDIPILDWIESSVSYNGYITNRKYPKASTSTLVGWATMVVPTAQAYWPTGEPGPAFEGGVNPVVNTSFDAGYNQTDGNKSETIFKLSIKPPVIEGLSIDGFFNYDIDHQNQKQFYKPWTLYYATDNATRNSDGFITSMVLEPRVVGLNSPELTESNYKTRETMYNVSMTYGRTLGNHTFSLFGAYEQYDQSYKYFSAYRKYFISDLVQALDAGGETDKTNSGSLSIYARKSWLGRVNYAYQDKYLAEFIVRRDGSLKFPPSKRWGTFPAALLAWRISEEPFWKEKLSFIDYLKIRATYGKMGMDPGDSFQFINKYALGTGITLGSDKNIVTKISQSVVANNNITWETQASYNIGFDSKFLNSMLFLNFEAFKSRRSNILVARNASVPDFTGLSLPSENIGKVDNKGIEVEAGFNKKIGDLFVSASGNISWARNKVVFMDEAQQNVPWQQVTGHPYGSALVYQAIGIFKSQAEVDAYPHWAGAKPGDVIFKDVSGDGKINADDRILLDKSDAPELFYGAKLDLQYKSWSLSVLGQGQGSYYVSPVYGNRGVGMNTFEWIATDYWTPENSNSNKARPFHRADQYWSYNSNSNTYWYDNMAYFRLKNVTLSYSLPQKWVNKAYMSSASLYFAGHNLCLLYSAQRNYDPETADPQGYPAVKTFSFGVNITF